MLNLAKASGQNELLSLIDTNWIIKHADASMLASPIHITDASAAGLDEALKASASSRPV